MSAMSNVTRTLVLCLGAACARGGGDDLEGAPGVEGSGEQVEAWVGPEGGALTLESGVTLSIPPGALDEEVRVVLTEVAGSPPWSPTPLSPRYRVEPAGLSLRVPAELIAPSSVYEDALASSGCEVFNTILALSSGDFAWVGWAMTGAGELTTPLAMLTDVWLACADGEATSPYPVYLAAQMSASWAGISSGLAPCDAYAGFEQLWLHAVSPAADADLLSPSTERSFTLATESDDAPYPPMALSTFDPSQITGFSCGTAWEIPVEGGVRFAEVGTGDPPGAECSHVQGAGGVSGVLTVCAAGPYGSGFSDVFIAMEVALEPSFRFVVGDAGGSYDGVVQFVSAYAQDQGPYEGSVYNEEGPTSLSYAAEAGSWTDEPPAGESIEATLRVVAGFAADVHDT
jgi:hypothetical protein